MKVRELKRQLESVGDETDVVLARDEEGNGFKPLELVELSHWSEEEERAVHPDDVGEYEPGELGRVVVLWPYEGGQVLGWLVNPDGVWLFEAKSKFGQ